MEETPEALALRRSRLLTIAVAVSIIPLWVLAGTIFINGIGIYYSIQSGESFVCCTAFISIAFVAAGGLFGALALQAFSARGGPIKIYKDGMELPWKMNGKMEFVPWSEIKGIHDAVRIDLTESVAYPVAGYYYGIELKGHTHFYLLIPKDIPGLEKNLPKIKAMIEKEKDVLPENYRKRTGME